MTRSVRDSSVVKARHYLNVRINKILSGNNELGSCRSERSPIFGLVNIKEGLKTANSTLMQIFKVALAYVVSRS